MGGNLSAFQYDSHIGVQAVDIIENNTKTVKEKIAEQIPFLEEQVSVQTKLAKKFGNQEYRKNLHENLANNFLQSISTLQESIQYINKLEENQANKSASSSDGIQLTLKFEEVADLPEEVRAELSLSDSDKTEYQIRSLIEELGGIASLDRLIVGIYKETGEVIKRSTITSKLYRMSQKGIVFGVPGRKGAYSIEDLTEEEAERLIKGIKE